MPAPSTLARLWQGFLLALLGAALGWLAWHWGASPARALAGVLTILLGYAVLMAAEFAVLGVVARRDRTPVPTAAEVLRAWWGEIRVAPLVFGWRQAFAWRAQPDLLDAPGLRGRRGAVFIHGFVCNRGLWTDWLARLRAAGHAFAAVNLEPVFGSIDDYIPLVEDAVRGVEQATGLPPVLVCHSMGGLAARAWLARQPARQRVHRVITIGSPHHGTWLGRLSIASTNGAQMALHSDWLAQLRRAEGPQAHARFTCWHSNCDNIVFPTSTATLEGADNRLVRGAGHVELVFVPELMRDSLALITGRR